MCSRQGLGYTYVFSAETDDPAQVIVECLLISRKLYWTDGDNISMANMDGSNHTTLFTSQKGPVGEQTYSLKICPQVQKLCMHDIIVDFDPQASPLTTKKSSCIGSAQEMGPLTTASWMERNWRSWKVLKANFPKLQHWPSWVRLKK